MDDITPLAQFIERMKTDKDLRRRIDEAEQSVARDIGSHTEIITRIAAEAGYDITGWNNRPTARYSAEELEAGDSCTLTCCVGLTSTT
jgi:hypothetical protein